MGKLSLLLTGQQRFARILPLGSLHGDERDSGFSDIDDAILGRPLLSTSVPQGTDGFYTDPEEIFRQYRSEIDLILDAGICFNKPSTIVDFTSYEPQILREGAGPIEALQY